MTSLFAVSFAILFHLFVNATFGLALVWPAFSVAFILISFPSCPSYLTFYKK